jgi:hypothetical protein
MSWACSKTLEGQAETTSRPSHRMRAVSTSKLNLHIKSTLKQPKKRKNSNSIGIKKQSEEVFRIGMVKSSKK